MTLIKSISGIRGTIGGKTGDNLTPVDAVKFASAYGTWLKNNSDKEKLTVVIGRDARISGPMIHNLVANTLRYKCYRPWPFYNTNGRGRCTYGRCRWWYYTYRQP